MDTLVVQFRSQLQVTR